MKDAQPSHAPTFFRVVYFLLGLLGALLLALLLALWLNWTSSLASSFASLMQATTTSKCFFKASGLAFSPFSRSDLVLFSIFALCQLLKHGLLVLQACLAQGLFFTFFKASSKLLWVLVGISLAFFSFFKPSSKDKGASPSSSSSLLLLTLTTGQGCQVSFFAFGLALALAFAFFKALALPFPRLHSMRECRSLSKAFCHSSSSSSPIGIFLAKVARLCMPAHMCFHHIRSIHRLPAAPSTGAFAGDQSSTFQMHVLLLLCPPGIHLFLCQPLLFLFQGAFSGGTFGDLAKGGLAFLHQEDYVGQAFFFLAHRLVLLFQGFIAILFQVGLVLVIGIALSHQRR